ncbi:MAG: 4-hydroxy-3-methylbut-2-enyl diphosphate reductase [Candidatus Omnitrophica bacterium]|nr:4-hydroxy-3-methylbut-2-enyl diphosphate reductase [Candidatus Omnitrophota bacterium]
MKINLAKSAGFCFGVKRAINIAFDTAETKSPIEMLGDIVHNEEVVKEIEKIGIKKVGKLTPDGNKILLIRAHGAPLKTFQIATRLNYQIVDATCPMVKEIHKIAQDSEKKGYRIIIIGDKKHNEVQGIAGQLKEKAIIIENIRNIPIKKSKNILRAAVVVQSTQNLEKTLAIVAILKKHIKELKFFNTICRPTRMKQQEIRIMPKKNDVMIIIGSKTSANTKRLYEIAKSLNRRSFWIQSKKDLKPDWFKNIKSIGITAGASTPDSTTNEVIQYIRKDSQQAL